MSESTSQSQHQGPGDGLSRRAFVRAAAAGGVVAAGAAGFIGWSSTRSEREHNPLVANQTLTAARVSGALSRDPGASAWLSLTAVNVPLLAQNMATPRTLTPSITSLQLRAAHNGNEIGFHLRWSDATVEDIEAIARFRDSVAVQLPVDPNTPTSVMMGQIGRPVHILHWRASWQAEMAAGGRSVRTAFPNAVNDMTPQRVLGEEASRVFYPALYVGNPMASRTRTSAVEELIAEGYGSLTPHAEQRAEGFGVQADGAWSVVIAMPLAGGQNKARLRPGGKTLVAVAAWDGGIGNRGARKQWSNWLALELSP
jgi:DMSO reductase family type II enzyme heme b subunit